MPSPLFPDFTPFDVVTDAANNITIHGIRSNNHHLHLPPVLLLHGFPQTHAIWHKVAPALLPHYTLVALDLRGYGASSKPPPTPSHAPYSKSAMASDCVHVMRAHFNYSSFYVLAHDRGARVAHQLCVNHPDAVQKAMLLDICPTLAMFEKTDAAFARAYWHWFFLSQSAPVPETFMKAAPAREWLALFTVGAKNTGAAVGKRSDFFTAEAFEAYVQAAEREGAVEAFCEDYRAAATVDCEEQKADRENGRKIKCDLRVLWGGKAVIERFFEALEEWRRVCEGEVSGGAVDSGHYVPEEVPDEVVRNAKEFFV
ncbi:Alpha/beta hydrolase fold-1 [Macrophomina phaseolina MS6]|uniref:Alpha/beta hydrolase fold-1 n=2 Tax=Macrophomina phaseolina TaxID=35725 RepID=K2RJU8_MACPH|nr:Alpha/beta hydrolase fold-1 [Macrophomina phaseolina MS6]KAH7030183.1 Alpha/Beta hydrolase protein [Macrophomina phaseolina]